MPSPDDLTQAGHRAAARPVPMPTIDEIEGRAAQRRTHRRAVMAASGLAVGIAVIAGAVVLRDRGEPVDTVAGLAAAHVESDTASNNDASGDEGNLIGDDDSAASHESLGDGSANIELHLADGLWMSADVVRGDEAAGRAETAAADADETRDVEGTTVWISRDGDKATVSALVEPDVFVAVTGPGDLLDRLVEALDNGVLIAPGLHFGEEIPDALEELFDRELPEGLEEFFGEGFDPEALDFERFFSDRFGPGAFDLEEFFGEGFDPESFDFGSDRFGEGFEGFDTEQFRSLFERFSLRLDEQLGELPFSLDDLPRDPADIEGFFDDLKGGDFGELWPDGHLGCLSINASGSDGGPVSLQIPEDCLDS